MAKWQLQEAKAKFSKVVEDAVEKGPQIVTKRGVETVAVISIDDLRKLEGKEERNWKDVLLAPTPKFDIPLPKRSKFKLRPTVIFD